MSHRCHMPAPSLFLLSLTVLAPAAACGGGPGEGSDPAVRIDTLPNGTIRVRNPAPAASGPPNWRAVEIFRLGSVDGSQPERLFGEIGALELDDLGRLYVLDRTAREVRVFDAGGAHVRTFGRPGGGPGELENPVGLAWDPQGRLWVEDPGNARHTVYDTTGGLVATYRRLALAVRIPANSRFGRDGRLYEPTAAVEPGASSGQSVLAAYGVAGELVPEGTYPLPVHEQKMFRVDIEGGFVFAVVPFSPRLSWQFDGEGAVWWGTGESYRLIHQALGGDTLRIVERAWSPDPVTAEERRDAVERLRGFLREGIGRVDLSRIPDAKPAFESFVLDRHGRPWVRRPLPPERTLAETEYEIFDAEGVLIGAVRLPFEPYPPLVAAGDRVAGVSTDELGVPWVIAYRIEGAAPAF